jgi:hypothetical protein
MYLFIIETPEIAASGYFDLTIKAGHTTTMIPKINLSITVYAGKGERLFAFSARIS